MNMLAIFVLEPVNTRARQLDQGAFLPRHRYAKPSAQRTPNVDTIYTLSPPKRVMKLFASQRNTVLGGVCPLQTVKSVQQRSPPRTRAATISTQTFRISALESSGDLHDMRQLKLLLGRAIIDVMDGVAECA
jgi:hypothetical protein